MKKVIFLYVILFLYSCNNKVEKILTTNDKWVLKTVEDKNVIFLGHFFYFNNDGTYRYYHSFNEKKIGKEIFSLHEQTNREWSLKGEDSIYLGNRNDKNFSYKIIRYNSDTLWLMNYASPFLLIKFNDKE